MARLLVPALALVVAGCDAAPPSAPGAPLADSGPSPPAAAADGGTFRYSMEEPRTIVPGDVVDASGLTIVDVVFDSLTARRPDGQIGPGAASGWEASETASTWTFHLRAGATFHTGEQVRAGDFVFAWTRAVRAGAAGYHLRDVLGYDELRDGTAATLAGAWAPDDDTLVVRLARPDAEFPAVVSHPALGPLPQERYRADPQGFAERPSGNGPFRLFEPWARDQFIRVERYDAWRGGAGSVPLAMVEFRFEDADTAYVAFQQERRDFAPLPPGALEEARGRYDVLDGPSAQLYFLGVNLRAPPFDRVETRRALSLAIDRNALPAILREGNVTPARSAVPPGVEGARPRPCAACVHDPDEARRLFAEAGVTDLDLWITPGGGHEEVARVLGEQLAAVGVTVRTRMPGAPSEPGGLDRYLAALRSGEASLFRFGWALDHPTLGDALTPLFAGGLADAEGAANYGGYAQADVDALLNQARSMLDPEERRALYHQVEDLALNRDQAIVPVMTLRHAAVVSDRVEGLVLDPLGGVNLHEARLVDESATEAG